MIPSEHMVRFINKAIDRLDTQALIESYPGVGTSAYNPVMLLKVLIYEYASKIYNSRRIAKALREDVHFMWISGMNRPYFRTINNFRSGRLKTFIERIFISLLELLLEEGFISREIVSMTKPIRKKKEKVKNFSALIQKSIFNPARPSLYYIPCDQLL